ncbi:hypothetical protein ACLB2K_047081 [Fragaria x ananassa]
MTVSFQQPPPPQSQPQPQPDGDQVQGPQPGLERAARVRRLRPGQHGLSDDRGKECSLAHGSGVALNQVSRTNILQVILVSPQIPGNTGCIARTCAASAVGLHLVGPMGFQIDDAKLKRAGLDYWPYPLICNSL